MKRYNVFNVELISLLDRKQILRFQHGKSRQSTDSLANVSLHMIACYHLKNNDALLLERPIL